MQGTVCTSGQELMAGELAGPRGDLLRGPSANVLHVLFYMCRAMQLPAFLTKASLCGGQWLSQELTTSERTANTSKGLLSGASVLPFSQGSGDNTEEEERVYEPEIRKDGDKAVFWTNVLMNSQ